MEWMKGDGSANVSVASAITEVGMYFLFRLEYKVISHSAEIVKKSIKSSNKTQNKLLDSSRVLKKGREFIFMRSDP
jgi:hypothetical protein